MLIVTLALLIFAFSAGLTFGAWWATRHDPYPEPDTEGQGLLTFREVDQ